jgi:hypothetical protein
MSSLVVISPILLAGALVLNIVVLIRANRACSPRQCMTRRHKERAYETREPIRGSNVCSLSSEGVTLLPLIVCALLAFSFALLSCAKRSENVAAAYVSPLAYEQFNCGQLAEEAGRVSQRAAELSGVQDRKRTGDIVATTAAIIVFWPAAFLVSGDDAQTAELARLKGEFEAMRKVSIQKGCGTRFESRSSTPR